MQKINEAVLKKSVELCKQRGVIIPTLKQMINPTTVPEKIQESLKSKGLWDLSPENLFRITWKNEATAHGGGFSEVPNHLVLPKELTGTDAKVVCLVGKYFPTGAHKVGATFVPLVEELTSGAFDPTSHRALWPSTGNYCRGGAFDGTLLGCTSIAVLPEDMSAERFEWLQNVGAEIHATPGCESNVKEVFDKTKELKANDPDGVHVFNQFAVFGNPAWHYNVTGRAIEEVYNSMKTEKSKLAGMFSCTGSAGTIASGDYLKEKYPEFKIAGGEALQCPTMLNNGFGGHRIEGIGDKHIPWIHNIRNMDAVGAIDDNDAMRFVRLCNTPEGQEVLRNNGVGEETLEKMNLMGISGAANVLGAIKLAKHYQLTEDDVVFAIFTDSMEMYTSRLAELEENEGAYSVEKATSDFDVALVHQTPENFLELTMTEKKRIHNLKYYTWIEQQGMQQADLDAQWDDLDYFKQRLDRMEEIDGLIENFNDMTGLLKEL
eukprot:TRINITY_DN305_c0_g2_i1.p1 TRINITY_DN305_c0_g2~~TRINITY_DN305_c0_g2_i1.p1  ORF type:complete len:490 (+),score=161.35 TRINITY_DN305_c0_g2_i1:211-1680(+)